MEIGVQIPHTGLAGGSAAITPQLVGDWCRIADESGFGVLWAYDHLLLPRQIESTYTMKSEPWTFPDDAFEHVAPNLELTTTMAFAAAATKRIKIGSSISVLTIRNALLNARQLATLDWFSGGRILYGAGVGWMKEEADAGNMPWDRRGSRAEEHIALLRALWTAHDGFVEFHGEFWQIPPSSSAPMPVQQPIPILIGGHAEVAIDRAVRLGDGWITGPVSTDRLAALMELVRTACVRHDRDPSTLPIYARVGTKGTDIGDIHRYAESGVHSLHVDLDTLDELRRFAEDVLPKVE